MRIEPNLYLIGSGRLGFDLTDPFDCNIFLLDSGDGYVIFDSGAGMDMDQILHVCQQDGIDPAQIRHLFLTHAHADHAGGAAYFRERVEPIVYAGADTARIVRSGDAAAVSLDAARDGGMYPADYVYRACPVDHVLVDEETVAVGNWEIQAISTPGHSHDHVSYLVTIGGKRYLLGGDVLFFGGKIILQNTYDCSVPQSIASIQRLQTLDWAFGKIWTKKRK